MPTQIFVALFLIFIGLLFWFFIRYKHEPLKKSNVFLSFLWFLYDWDPPPKVVGGTLILLGLTVLLDALFRS